VQPLDPHDLDLPALQERLRAHEPDLVDTSPRRASAWQAATALVLVPGEASLDLAMIQRTERPGDRWSGQMALPGGKRDPEDADLAATARRESFEEIGVELGAPLGRLDDHRSRTRPGTVACFVFGLPERPVLRPQPTEVAAASWLPVAALLDPTRSTHLRYAGMRFPGIAHEGQVIWGLTLKTLENFLAVLGRQRPVGRSRAG
jgi:8-oxo-dGTP pyrophosphatase MutT (NUDIX family)